MTTSPVIMFIKEFFRVTWLSVSSTKFYPDVYTKYKGFGLKYSAIVITITTLIYAIFIVDSIFTIRAYLASDEEDNNPVEYIVKQWPEVKYDGKEIDLMGDEPVIIKTMRGNATIGIDPDNKLSQQQKQLLSILLKKKQIVVYLEQGGDGPSKSQEVAFGYSQVFGSEPMMLDQNGLKNYLLTTFQPSSIALLFIATPFFILLRMTSYILSSLFIMGLLFVVLWGLKAEPTIKSVTRVIIFSGGIPEIVSVLLMLFEPRAIALATLIQYWTLILAIYSLAKMDKGKRR